jgi:hypothetical protein
MILYVVSIGNIARIISARLRRFCTRNSVWQTKNKEACLVRCDELINSHAILMRFACRLPSKLKEHCTASAQRRSVMKKENQKTFLVSAVLGISREATGFGTKILVTVNTVEASSMVVAATRSLNFYFLRISRLHIKQSPSSALISLSHVLHISEKHNRTHSQ